jgi:hypothetical protein
VLYQLSYTHHNRILDLPCGILCSKAADGPIIQGEIADFGFKNADY